MNDLNNLLIEEFYKIFSQSKEGIYAGSREQMRLTLQIKLGFYIPISYLDRILKAFISSKLILSTNETKEIERQIGKRFYKSTPQRLYCVNEDIKDKQKILDSLKVTFNDFSDKLSDLVLETDLKRLRQLETDKQIKLQDIVGRKTYPYTFKFTDVEFLYDIPRSSILDSIDKLERYDLIKVEEKRNKTLETKRKLQQERSQQLNRIYKKQIEIVKKTLDLEGTLIVKLYKNGLYYGRGSTQIGIFEMDTITFEEGKLILTDNTAFKIIAEVGSFDINSEENTVSFLDENLEYKMLVNKSLVEEMEFLEYLHENVKVNQHDYI